MTALLLPAALLLAASAQDVPASPPAPIEQVAPPIVIPTVTAPPPAAPAETITAQPPAAANDDTAELRDPLADPAEARTAAADPSTIVVQTEKDPLEGFNRAMFGIHQKLDKAAYRPVAMGYKQIVPKPVRSGVRNIFSNLSEPIAFVNFLLQLKFGKAMETLARFTINSTIGVGGLFDVAKARTFNLPHRRNGFGDTLAYYGVGPGPYLFLPMIGPTTLRDLLGTSADGALLPTTIGRPFNSWQYNLAQGVTQGLDKRVEADEELKSLLDGAVDPYATLRSAFLQNRAGEVAELRHGGKKAKPDAELDDPLTDPGAHPGPAPDSDARELQDPLQDPASPN